jgi:hypothetical protein
MLKNLQQLQISLESLKEKITNFKKDKELALNQAQTKFNETSHKLELALKEQTENEQLLERLLKEMGELEESLNA